MSASGMVTLDQLLDFFDAILPDVNHHQQFTLLDRAFEAFQTSVRYVDTDHRRGPCSESCARQRPNSLGRAIP